VNREQRRAEALATATAQGVERAQRAPALAAAKQAINDELHSLGRREPIEAARDEQGRFKGQGLDQGSRGGGTSGSAPQDANTTMNERLRGNLASRKGQEED
jgi:hypothetical protein